MLKTLSGRNPSQNEYELTRFIALLNARRVRRYLEIGARHGDTFYTIMTSLPPGSYGVAVDLPGGLWGTVKSKSALLNAVEQVNKSDRIAREIFGNSQDIKVVSRIQQMAPFDAILIDGDHTLPGVTQDWNLYRKMAPLIAFHDIVGIGMREKIHSSPVEVPLLWDRLKSEGYKVHEFIDHGSAMGIGVLEMPCES